MYITDMNSNNISEQPKKYECQQCKLRVDKLLWKNKFNRMGYLCDKCWKTYEKRMKQIYGKI